MQLRNSNRPSYYVFNEYGLEVKIGYTGYLISDYKTRLAFKIPEGFFYFPHKSNIRH